MTIARGSDELMLLLETFEKHKVKYLIIGGFAVNRYGYSRTTGDVDIFLKDTRENRQHLIDALEEMEYGRMDELLDAPIIAGYCEIMMDSGIYADLMTSVPGLNEDFDLYFNMATIDEMDGYVIRFLHYDHLIQNKAATGRPKDLLDIEALKQINRNDTSA